MRADDTLIEPAEAARQVEQGLAILIDVVEVGAWASLRQLPAGSLRQLEDLCPDCKAPMHAHSLGVARPPLSCCRRGRRLYRSTSR